jgi:hypothetical protein
MSFLNFGRAFRNAQRAYSLWRESNNGHARRSQDGPRNCETGVMSVSRKGRFSVRRLPQRAQ